MFVVNQIKKRLHRDIVSDPAAHASILNLYLNGEDYPQRVDDYFPLYAVDEPELLALMTQHQQDEDKHVKLYAKAIKKLEQPVVRMDMSNIFNDIIRRHTRSSFHIRPADSAQTCQLKLAHFLAHAHFLEKRVTYSLEHHLDACAQAGARYAESAVSAVLADEYRHVSYSKEAVFNLLSSARAKQVLAEHEQAEQNANLDFSATQLRRLVQQHHAALPGFSRLLYKNCIHFLEIQLRYSR